MADDDRKRSKDGRLVDAEDGKPIEIKRPKSDGGKRRFDKRKRVWVIDKDGKVKKVWKDDKESPDSGVEDDEVDGEGGSTGRKTLSSQGEKDKEADDLAWAKKHGRKGLKDSKEIVEKGDKKQGSAKLQKKMKGMASARKSARFRKSASRSAMSRSCRTGKSTSYFADDDGERSWGSSDGEYEEVIIENEEENLKDAQEAAENKRNEEMEKRRQLEGKDAVEKATEKLQGEPDALPVATATVISEVDQKDKKKEKDAKGAKGAKTTEAKESEDKKTKAEDSQKGVKEKQVVQEMTEKGAAGAAATAGSTSANVETATKKPEAAKEADKGKGKGKGKGKTSTVKAGKTESTKIGPSTDKAGKTESTKIGPSTDKAVTEKPIASDALEKVPDVTESTSGTTIPAKELGGAAAGGAGVIAIAAAAKKLESDKKKEQKEKEKEQKQKEKEQKQKEKEQKQKEKEEKKREKEEKKMKEKEEREMAKKAAATKEEPVVKYVDVKTTEEVQPPIIIQPEGKEKDIDKKSDQDSGHASPRSASDTERKVDDVKKKETELNLSSEKTLSASLKPRREQSIVIDMDRSKSTLDTHERQPTGSGDKTLEAVSELLDTARERADAFAEGKQVPSPSNSADQKSRLLTQTVGNVVDSSPKKADQKSRLPSNSPTKGKSEDQASESVERGTPTETKGKEKGGKKATDTKTVAKKGAITQKQVLPVTQITVDEAKDGSKTDLSQEKVEQTAANMQDLDTDFESSEEEFVPVKRPKQQAFAFPDENKLISTFRTTGDIIHTMPIKKKVPRRMPRKTDVDLLPQRTSQAFGLTGKAKPLPGKPKEVALKDAASKSSQATENKRGSTVSAVAVAKGPITIKDLSKKPVKNDETEEDLKNARGPLDLVDAGNQSEGDAKTSISPNRRKSEFDRTQHLQLMTQLMSLPESETTSRAQSRKSGQSKPPTVPEINLGNFSDRGKNGTPDLLQTARQDAVVASRPPNQHSYKPSRENSAAPRGTSGHTSLTRSHSDRRTNSVTFPDSSRTGCSKSSSSTNSEERFARFKEGVLKQLGELGKEELNAILYPRVQRYPEEEEEGGAIKRGRAAYKSMGTLQRIHRKNRQVAPHPVGLPPIKGAYGGLIDDYDDIDDPRMKGLLEELYCDKKYLDKSLVSNPEQDEYVRQRTVDGRMYLLNRARFWSTQRPLVRPGTQAGSRSSTAIPSSRLVSAIRNERTRSEERPSKK